MYEGMWAYMYVYIYSSGILDYCQNKRLHFAMFIWCSVLFQKWVNIIPAEWLSHVLWFRRNNSIPQQNNHNLIRLNVAVDSFRHNTDFHKGLHIYYFGINYVHTCSSHFCYFSFKCLSNPIHFSCHGVFVFRVMSAACVKHHNTQICFIFWKVE